MIKKLVILGLLSVLPLAHADVNLFTEHQVIGMVKHGVNKYDDVRFPTGDVPYIGKLGVEYEKEKLTYSLAYIHRSNVDIHGQDEYNYDGVALGLKYKHCIADCKK